MDTCKTPLSPREFQDPPAHYRAAPFWAWNCKLDGEELERQIDCFREMGFGGFHMHPRTGLGTPYLGEEFLGLVRRCVEKAKQNGMEACLYDEDRWPSGFAGGLVTQNEAFRAQHILWTRTPYQYRKGFAAREYWSADPVRSENGHLLACYEVRLDADGFLAGYRIVSEAEPVEGARWYAYLESNPSDVWYNGQAYVDTLNKKAIDRFIEITYDAYERAVGDCFGRTVPSIFTDEPQFAKKVTLRFPDGDTDAFLPWTVDFAETFHAAYGEDILVCLPELFWELPGGAVSVARYRYHDHVTERFTEAFADNCGAWCQAHGLALTGHLMEEPTLESQTACLGEAMRAYRSFVLPGVDMLCNRTEYTTVKQAASASHQYGREGVLSELYGVTSWSFDFRGHIFQGDWQAALGVTRRVPHLSLVSMEGEAKRDYPASINYQAPWWREYHLVEDHFARVNAALTRGKPVIRVGVIHPIESYWLHWGPSAQTALHRAELDRRFQDLTKWLLFGAIDFDFISEALLPSQCPAPGAPLQVGEMAYDVILVPGCETLRGSTVAALSAFRDQNGTLLFLGEAPTLVDAAPNPSAQTLWARSERLPFERASVLEALEPWREVDLFNEKGERTEHLLSQLREDAECRWLFLARGVPVPPDEIDAALPRNLRVTLRGGYAAEAWDTMNGTIHPLETQVQNGRTRFQLPLCQQDSLLVRLTPTHENRKGAVPNKPSGGSPLEVPSVVPITLDEPNVLLLDRAEFALDARNYEPAQELLRIDTLLRERLGFPSKRRTCAQPWTLSPEPIEHRVRLRYTFDSEISTEARLALEDASHARVWLDGREIAIVCRSYYVDRSISTLSLGTLEPGRHALEMELPFTRQGSLENCMVLGDFGVRVRGLEQTMIAPVQELGFGDITGQGLPFYGGNVTYHLPVAVPTAGRLRLHVPHWRGALVTAAADGEPAGAIILAPYDLDIPLETGRHRLDVTLYGTRVNTFGALHMRKDTRWLSPASWRHTGDRWSEEYVWEATGLLSSPRLTWFETHSGSNGSN